MYTLAQLKNELITDPDNLGYAQFSPSDKSLRNDTELCNMINLPRSKYKVRRSDVSGAEIYSCIAIADMIALPTNPTAVQLSNERRSLAYLTGLAPISSIALTDALGADGPIIANMKAMFTAGSATLIRLSALTQRDASRAEFLVGAGTFVPLSDIAAALNL